MATKAVAQLAGKCFSLGYGIISLALFMVLATVRKRPFRKLDAQAKKELALARERLWDLNAHPSGLNHRFCPLRNGKKLHYVESLPTDAPAQANLVIFIHGYPDSYALWLHYLKSQRLSSKAVLIAVDLPGYGGSDSLDSYGSNDIMEAMADFVLKMRDVYLSDGNGRVVIVSHDWGALIAFRLASEAPQLADRFIMSNSLHPALAAANVKARLSSARQMAHTWLQSPLSLRLLRRALSNVAPVFRQVFKSGYIFVFNLPFKLPTIINAGDHWWFRYLNALSTHPDPPQPLSGARGAELLASSLGPSANECSIGATANDIAYSDSVRQRASTGGFTEKLRIYREGLAFRRWKQSLETLWSLNQIQPSLDRKGSINGAGLFDTDPEGSLKSPTTVIWGKGDIALENAIAIEGLRDYFGVRSSQLIMVSRCGHWSPIEKQGIPIFEAVIEWAVTGEQGTVKDVLEDTYPLAKVVIEK